MRVTGEEQRVADAKTCGNCGASIKRLDTRVCGFCGVELPRDEAPVVVTTPHRDLAARFAALRVHADWPELMQRTPAESHVRNLLLFQMIFGLFFAGIGGFMALVFILTILMIPFAILPLSFLALGVWAVVDARKKTRRFDAAELQRVPALVVDERVKVSGGVQGATPMSSYFASLELEDGTRVELPASGSVAGRVTKGDVGVAYIKGRHLLDFARVRV